MPSFSDSIFLFILALLLFGPKKLPVLARELGKWVGEFRRASNEFKMQMEEELRLSEQEERRQQIAAMEAAAPLPAAAGERSEPEHPHLQPPEEANPGVELPPARQTTAGADAEAAAEAPGGPGEGHAFAGLSPDAAGIGARRGDGVAASAGSRSPQPEPLPIAASGELRMMPPATGLPMPRSRSSSQADGGSNGALSTLVSSIPHDESGNGSGTFQESEGAAHSH